MPGAGDGSAGERLPSWFRMSSTYFFDDKIMSVSVQAEVAFLRLVAFASQIASNGTVSVSQCSLIMHKLRSYRQVIDELVTAKLVSMDPSCELIYITRWNKWQGRGGGGNAAGDVPAVQRPADESPRARAHTRGPAREREIREEVEEGRTPSGSVRPSSAAAAPPRADAGAQPQQNEDQSQRPRGPGRRAYIEGDEDTRSWRDLRPADETTGVSSVGQAKLAEMRAELARRQETNPYSRRRPVKMVPDGWRNTEPPIRAEVVLPIEECDDPNPPQALGYLMSQILPPPPDFPEWEVAKE